MAQQSRVSGRATAIFTDREGFTNVIYHNTAVVRFNADTVILNNGGWKTVTTKTRMNQAARQFKLPYGVSQVKGVWYTNNVPWEGCSIAINRKTGKVSQIKGGQK